MLSNAPDHLGDTPIIVGVDEAGRGPLAGPVVAAAVVLCQHVPEGLDDSKKLSAKRRAELEPQIRGNCAWALGVVEPDVIDRVNIFAATMLAMTQAVDRLCLIMAEKGHGAPHEVLIDGNMTPKGRVREWTWPARAIVGGDGIEPCISAASIIAKEHRDRLMAQAVQEHDAYGWERNKGYATREHLEALRVHGPTPHHRKSFAPVSQMTLV